MTARRLLVTAAVIALATAQAAAVGRADTAPLQDSPDLPWTNPTHETALELLAGEIASDIAGRTVSVHCQGDTDWRLLVVRQGGNPDAELGFVGVNFRPRDGSPVAISGSTELSGQRICLPLKRFAVATTKPTKCFVTRLHQDRATVKRRVAVKKTVVVAGRRTVKTTWVTKRVPTMLWKASQGPLGPCYSGDPGTEIFVSSSFWDDYDDYATALLTLAHEAVHLGGIVGTRFASGAVLGDAQAEAKAQCFGMQRVRYVAERLGDTRDDADAIARYTWEQVYPRYTGTEYWSNECRAGGALDLHLSGGAAFP